MVPFAAPSTLPGLGIRALRLLAGRISGRSSRSPDRRAALITASTYPSRDARCVAIDRGAGTYFFTRSPVQRGRTADLRLDLGAEPAYRTSPREHRRARHIGTSVLPPLDTERRIWRVERRSGVRGYVRLSSEYRLLQLRQSPRVRLLCSAEVRRADVY